MWQRERGSQFPRRVRLAILTRDPICQLRLPGCTTTSTEADHITPTHLGGTNHISNGRGLCHNCHQIVTNQQAAEARRATLNKRLHPANRS